MLSLLLATLVAAPTPVATPARTIPHQHYEALPGHAIGILVGEPDAVLQAEGRSGPTGEVCFASGEASYRWIYSENGGAGTWDITGLTLALLDGGKKTYPRLRISNAASVGVEGRFHLVEATVNGGGGSPVDEHFVISGVKVLDGSRDYPIVVERAVLDAESRLDRWSADQADAVFAAMRRNDASEGRGKGSTPAFLEYVTWLPDREQLEVRFHERWTGNGGGVEADSAYRFDARGALAAEEHTPLTWWVAEVPTLPPPFPRHPISDPPFRRDPIRDDR